MRCFSRKGLKRETSRLLTAPYASLATSCRRTLRQRIAPSLGVYRTSPPNRLRRPTNSPRESRRALLQSELHSVYKHKKLHHTNTETHVNGSPNSANDSINTTQISQAVRGHSELPARTWGAASTVPVFVSSRVWHSSASPDRKWKTA